jgi:tRNA-2-methylthio-N6-dimethylallyladenosine synthase
MLQEKLKEFDESLQGEAIHVETSRKKNGKILFLESYGCAMNFSDSEIVVSILMSDGYTTTKNVEEANVILINTCSIRDNAEQRVKTRLKYFNNLKRAKKDITIGVLGCMAERLKGKWLEEEKLVDIVVGPDAYRSLPFLLDKADEGEKSVNVLLSREETYADLSPIKLNSNGVTAFVSIMRGCDNMCSFCVVPYTRGRERSRDPETIVHEAKYLFEQGYREVTLLGQNVDSYRWNITKKGDVIDASKEVVSFAQLIEKVALIHPDLRIRFSTSHPKDMTDDVLQMIAKYENVCNCVHLPVQSGSSEILEKMNRGYTREWYLQRVEAIQKIVPGCSISSDFIIGFCGETEEQHLETVSLMREVVFDHAYMYKYSERPQTLAERKYTDDVTEEIKQKRLEEVIAIQRLTSHEKIKRGVGKVHKVLIENTSKKDQDFLSGRNSENMVLVFPKGNAQIGTYVNVLATHCTSATLIGNQIL